MPASLRSFTDAAADAVARSIAAIEREAKRERELRDAQFAARMAELTTAIESVEALRRQTNERLASLKDGEPGRDGADGLSGRDGRDGVDGKDGADGRSLTIEDIAPLIAETVAREIATLPQAKDGRDGVDGKDGADGSNGRDGADGKDGERGSEGPAGKLPIVSTWEDRVYYEGEVVTRDGGLFQANCDTGKEPGHEDWRCIVAAGSDGKDGADGRSFNVRETWKDDGEYSALDVVALNGASFAARCDNPGPCPGEGWQIMAMQGKRGAPGETGKPGQKGETGHVRAVTAARVDDNGLFTLVNADGTTVECDLYPVLSRLG